MSILNSLIFLFLGGSLRDWLRARRSIDGQLKRRGRQQGNSSGMRVAARGRYKHKKCRQ